MKHAPIVNIVLPIILGIILSNWIQLPLWILLTIVAFLIIPLIIFTFYSSRYLYYFFHYPFWVVSGILLVSLHNPLRHSNHYSNYLHPKAQIVATVVSPPQSTPNSTKMIVSVDAIDTIPTIGRMMLFVQHSPNSDSITYGDNLIMIATPQQPSASDNPFQFNYQQYLKNRDIYYQTYLSSNQYILIHNNPKGLMSLAIAFRQNLIDKVQQLQLTDSQKGIVEALFLGWDNDLSEIDRQQFRDVGLAHLLCVSGLHVGIVAGLISMFLFFGGRGPRMRIVKGIIQLIGVWLFALLTGLAPATTRASLMFSFFIIGNMFFLQRNSYNTLAASVLILLIFNPSLIYDIGFQLSYSAVLGILSLLNPLYNLIPWRDRAILECELDPLPFFQRQLHYLPFLLSQKLWSLVCLTTAAQLSVLPITLFYFHQFPTYFLIANLIIVPFAGVLLFTILLAILFYQWAFPAMLLSVELVGIERLTHWISNLPYASFNHIYFDVFMLISSIVMLLSFIIWLHRKSTKLYLLSILSLLILLIHFRIEQYQCNQQQFYIIYSLHQHSAIEFFDGRHTTLWADSTIIYNPDLINYQNENLHTMTMSHITNSISIDTCKYIHFNNHNLFIVNPTNQWSLTTAHPSHLILTDNPSLSIPNLCKRINFDTLIITSNNSYYHRTKWSRECDSLNIPYYDISQKGAWIH